MANTIKVKGAKRLQKDSANQWQKRLGGRGPEKTKKGALGVR
jgi:hypothetical protein